MRRTFLVPILAVTVVALCPVFSAAAALAPRSGAVYAWGDDDAGQLGNGTISDPANHFDQDQRVPVAAHMPAGTSSVAVAGGLSDSYAVTTAGAMYAWGFNGDGEVGDGTRTATESPVESDLPAGVAATAVAAGYKQALALTAGGGLYAWGSNSAGQAGLGSTTPNSVITPSPVALPSGVQATAIATGADHDLAVSRAGVVYAWGLNADGQLGDGTTANSDVPVAVSLPGGARATAVAGGAAHSLALTAAGKVYAWGLNAEGQLGDGNVTSSDVPVFVKLPPGVVVTAIAAGDGSDKGLGGGYSLALTSTGAIYAWGDNASGNLGDDSTTDSDLPVLVRVPDGVVPVSITAGGNRCHLLSSHAAVYDWGSTEDGRKVHLVPNRDQMPAGETPVAIGDGPDAEQYLALMVPTQTG